MSPLLFSRRKTPPPSVSGQRQILLCVKLTSASVVSSINPMAEQEEKPNGDQRPSPSTDQEWIVHSLNIQGEFFERWCRRMVHSTPGWKVAGWDYPVEFPPPNGPFRGKQSRMDIRAFAQIERSRLLLAIECKKNNPEFVNWVFLPSGLGEASRSGGMRIIRNSTAPSSPGWKVESQVRSFQWKLPFADGAREVRGSYVYSKRRDLTKTSNSAISEASYQVSIAAQAVNAEEVDFSRALSEVQGVAMPFETEYIMPMIVTTGRLFMLDFNPADVSPKTGEIPLNGATMTEVPAVVLHYPLPKEIQMMPADLGRTLKDELLYLFVHLPIIVVNSISLQSTLHTLVTTLSSTSERVSPIPANKESPTT